MEPLIKVTPPGPKALTILKRDAELISQSMVREYPLVLQKAHGLNVWDVDDNRYLDFTAGIAVMAVGWNYPRVVRAIQEQAKYLSHGAFLDFCSEVPVKFAENIVELLPPDLDKLYFSNSGAESIEAAMKLARHHIKRKYFISFYGGFHERTYGAVSLTATKVIQRKQFGPFLPVIHSPFPNPYRPLGSEPLTCDKDVLHNLEEEIFKTEAAPEEVAAIFVALIQGEGGYIVPPKTFLKGLRRICDEREILLIIDEVQSGCYRTGKFLASEHFGVIPDIVCLSKAIGGGLPLGVTIASDEIMTWPPGSHASTFGGNNVACAAGMAALYIMKEDGFDDHVTKMGAYLLEHLKRLEKCHEIIGHVRGIGLMSAIELVQNRTTKEPAVDERNTVLNNAFKNGLTLLPAGESVIRFCPPLTLEKEDTDIRLDILEATMSDF
jgi:4-aminobutyrate aminotransferase